jgi:hypothetical protein
MLYIELPKRSAPPELLAIQDPDERYEKLSAFYASVGFDRFPVPRGEDGRQLEGSELEGFVESQKARLVAEAAVVVESE